MPGFQFICYSHLDGKEFAERLETALATSVPRIETWRDVHKLVAGDRRWTEQVGEALRDCDSLIWVMTPDSVREGSECPPEWDQVAIQYMKPAILLRMDRDAGFYRANLAQQIIYRGDFDKLVADVRIAIDHLFSPLGQLARLIHRLKETKRKLRMETNEKYRQGFNDRIKELEQQIAQQQAAIKDPDAARAAAQLRIDEEIADRRRAISCPVEPQVGGEAPLVVNTPPTEPRIDFRGRVEEEGLIRSWIKEAGCRLITITGRSGVGKTTLACHAIEQAVRESQQQSGQALRVVYMGSRTRAISCSNLFDDLMQIVPPARATQVREKIGASQLRADLKMADLLRELRPFPTVLLLDDFDKVLDPATCLIADPDLKLALETILVDDHHTLTTILTCRNSPRDLIDIEPGRQEKWELKGLPTPDGVQVLRDRDPGGQLKLRDAPIEVLEEMVQRTGGNPWALMKLVGALRSSETVTPQDLLEHLPEDLLQGLVGEAYATLDLTKRAVFQAMSMCTTTIFPRATTAEIDFLLLPYFPGIDSKPFLDQLVLLDLVRRDAAPKTYVLEQVEAEYARSRLARGEQGDYGNTPGAQPTQIAFLNRAVDYHKQLFKPLDQCKCKDDLLPQLAAFELMCSAVEFDQACDLLGDFDVSHLLRWGHNRLVSQLRQSLEGHLIQPNLQRYNAAVLGICYANLGYVGKAIELHERALELSRPGNEYAVAIELSCLGFCWRELGNTPKSMQLHNESLELFRKLQKRKSEGEELSNVGICFMDQADFPKAIESFSESIRIARELGDQSRQANRQANLALALLESGDLPKATAAASLGVSLSTTCDQRYFKVEARRAMAIVQLAAKKFPAARVAAEIAQKEDVNLTNHVVAALLGVIYLLVNRPQDAANAFRNSIKQADWVLSMDSRIVAALDAKGVACSGLAISDEQIDQREQHALDAQTTFYLARNQSSEPGVIAQLKRLLMPLLELDKDHVLADVMDAALTAAV